MKIYGIKTNNNINMKRTILCLLMTTLSITFAYSKTLTDSTVEKTGWLIYHRGHIIWVESKLDKNPTDEAFFCQAHYTNGLLVEYLPESYQFMAIAKEYEINILRYDSSIKKFDYILKENIKILPVRAAFKPSSRPISDLVNLQGLSFKRKTETTIEYKFETDYDILSIQLLREKDMRNFKRVKKLPK
jgi:hypothetical protein